MRNRWELDDGRVMNLLTPEDLKSITDGTELLCIDGSTVIKGEDELDNDTRSGYLAYGLEETE